MTISEKGCHIKGESHDKNACRADSADSIQSAKTEKSIKTTKSQRSCKHGKNENFAGDLTKMQNQQYIGSQSCCGDCCVNCSNILQNLQKDGPSSVRSVKSLKNKELYRDPSPAASCKSVTSVKSSASKCDKKEHNNKEMHRDTSPAPSCKSVASVKSSNSKCDKKEKNRDANRVPSPAPSCKSVPSVKSSARKCDKNEQKNKETHRDTSPSPSCKSVTSVLSSSSKCRKEEKSKNKEIPKVVIDPSTIRAELRAGVLMNNCDCVKKNGLQDFCPRNFCHKSSVDSSM
ncbi:uncharacterized protein [Diabrotica undecimpunctata]|uniref:uncharacterized protein n=1 Tax=Diabrotica undecimpunctata TaxID=50387 RepID=UPI003B63B5D6